jgi:acetoin utilization deacetylase AcuC-like enzyme
MHDKAEPLTLPMPTRRSPPSSPDNTVDDPNILPALLNSPTSAKNSDIFNAISKGDLEKIKKLLPDFANFQNDAGYTPLMKCVSCGLEDSTAVSMIKLLTDAKAKVTVEDREGFTVLHWAAACATPTVLKALLPHCTAIALHQASEGDSALHRACRMGKSDNAIILAKKFPGALAVTNEQLETPLDVAGVWQGRIFRLLRSEIFNKLSLALGDKLRSLVLHHPECLEHIPRPRGSQGDTPWEAPDRIVSVLNSLEKLAPSINVKLSSNFKPASLAQILLAHSQEYIDVLEDAAESPEVVPMTPILQRKLQRLPTFLLKKAEICDSSFSAGTLPAALRACGAACHAVEEVYAGRARNAFCLVRPPGHHAGESGPPKDAESCGFSFINNIAVAAFHALKNLGVPKVAILDFDVHHGNGTEQIIRARGDPDRLMFISVHLCDPGNFFPHSGSQDSIKQNIFNCPVTPMWHGGGGRFTDPITARVLPLLRTFEPSLILCSAGFDAAVGDVGNQRAGVGGSDLGPRDYARLTEQIMRVANLVCGGKVVSVLEGGYGKVGTGNSQSPDGKRQRVPKMDRESFANCVLSHVKTLSN